jgi:hypothetical protein
MSILMKLLLILLIIMAEPTTIKMGLKYLSTVMMMFAVEAGIFTAHTATIKLAQNCPTC